MRAFFPMSYCNATEKGYLEADLEALTGKCSCFLYDVHDPTSCNMGKVYMLSNFGGGADPWLYVSGIFFVCACGGVEGGRNKSLTGLLFFSVVVVSWLPLLLSRFLSSQPSLFGSP